MTRIPSTKGTWIPQNRRKTKATAEIDQANQELAIMVKDVLGGAYSILPLSENDFLNVHLPVGESERMEDIDEVGQIKDEPETRFEMLNMIWCNIWNQEV